MKTSAPKPYSSSSIFINGYSPINEQDAIEQLFLMVKQSQQIKEEMDIQKKEARAIKKKKRQEQKMIMKDALSKNLIHNTQNSKNLL